MSEMDDYRWSRLYAKVRYRARRKGVGFDLTKKEYKRLVERAAGVCEVTGIAFSLIRTGKAMLRPYAPSLDRIDAQQGYSYHNCRIVCVWANLAMNEWGEQLLYEAARVMLAHLEL